ncbi:MAG: TonB family protein [Bacteroidia bacterium]
MRFHSKNQADEVFTLVLILSFFSVFLLQEAYSQDMKESHSFKITGKTKLPIFPNSSQLKAVEYDPDSPDHLYISYFNKEGIVTAKRQFLFKSNKFNLANLPDYLNNNTLITDGAQIGYNEDGSITDQEIIKDGILQQKITFYLNGKRKLLSSGDEKIRNGECKMWYLNGQLSFSGNYKNDLKDGEFQLFDESGSSIRKGVYQDGKLVSGEAVVQEKVYTNTNKPAEYIKGEEAFNEYLKTKSKEIESLKNIAGEKKISVKFLVDKTGKGVKLEEVSETNPHELEFITAFFKELPEFTPALVEDTPVDSELNLYLVLSGEGLKLFSAKPSDVYFSADQMPEFPGGLPEMRKFLATRLRYPIEALKGGIKGKVLVNFVIDESGVISDVKIFQGVHPSLNDEALRVVNLMPKWEPGRIQGKPVKMSFTVPIIFNTVVYENNE